MDYKKIGQLIKKKRVEKDMTQQDLAEKLHVTDRAISKWERGIGAPDISLLQALSKILGISIQEVLQGEEQIKKELKTNDKIIITLCLIIPISILSLSLMLSIFRTEYLVIGAIFVMIAYFLFLKREPRKSYKRNVTWLLLIMYGIFILTTIFYTRITTGKIYPSLKIESNLIPFSSIIETLSLITTKSQGLSYLFQYFLLDILLFMPLGFFLPYLFPTMKTKRLLLITFLISLTKELLQLLFNVGMFNIDDILLNILGATIIYIAYKKICYNKKEAKNHDNSNYRR